MGHDEPTGWERYSLPRERAQARLLIVLATALVPAWIPFDYVLEPRVAPTFLAYRLADVAVGLALLSWLRRARTLRAVRATGAAKMVATGSIIALMLPAVRARDRRGRDATIGAIRGPRLSPTRPLRLRGCVARLSSRSAPKR